MITRIITIFLLVVADNGTQKSEPITKNGNWTHFLVTGPFSWCQPFLKTENYFLIFFSFRHIASVRCGLLHFTEHTAGNRAHDDEL